MVTSSKPPEWLWWLFFLFGFGPPKVQIQVFMFFCDDYEYDEATMLVLVLVQSVVPPRVEVGGVEVMLLWSKHHHYTVVGFHPGWRGFVGGSKAAIIANFPGSTAAGSHPHERSGRRTEEQSLHSVETCFVLSWVYPTVLVLLAWYSLIWSIKELDGDKLNMSHVDGISMPTLGWSGIRVR